MSLPDKFTIPAERIPRAWSQGVYNCCVAAFIAKVLEVINYVKKGIVQLSQAGMETSLFITTIKEMTGSTREDLMKPIIWKYAERMKTK